MSMIQKIFLGLVMLALILNGIMLMPKVSRLMVDVKQARRQQVGEEFKPLIPWLHQQHRIGYLDCRTSASPYTDAAIMAPYQQAQFVLSPVLLDFKQPRHYSHLILYCPDKAQRLKIKEKLDAQTLVQTAAGVLLLRRHLP